MKKFISFMLVISLLLAPLSSLAEETQTKDLDIFGEGAILIDATNGQVLFEKNSNKKLYPASTTKIMTAILALEIGDLKDIVTVDKEVVDLTEGSHIALDIGEQLSLEEMLYALLIESANDSALAIAKHISGDIKSFVQLMNKKAEELGAKNTNFVNPNGLHDDNHYTTAHDMALIAKYAMENKTFRDIVKNYTHNTPPSNKKPEARFLKSANKLLYSKQKIQLNGQAVEIMYPGVTGIKTGYTSKAKSCLVASFEADSKYLISVVLNSDGQNIFSDSHKLFNYGRNSFKNEALGFKNQFIENIKISKGSYPLVGAVLKEDVLYSLPAGQKSKVKSKVLELENLEAPIKKGDLVAKLEYRLDSKLIKEVDLLATMDVERDKSSLWYWKIIDKWYLIIFLLWFLTRIHIINKRRKLRQLKRKRQARSKKVSRNRPR